VISVSRHIDIHAELGGVAAFVREVTNLPRWTDFFRSVGARTDGYHAVESVVGPISTRILESTDGGGPLCTIESIIAGARETATVHLRPLGDAVRVEFTIALRDDASPELRAGADATLAQELARLRAICETAVGA
jgi:hypothetical protein